MALSGGSSALNLLVARRRSPVEHKTLSVMGLIMRSSLGKRSVPKPSTPALLLSHLSASPDTDSTSKER